MDVSCFATSIKNKSLAKRSVSSYKASGHVEKKKGSALWAGCPEKICARIFCAAQSLADGCAVRWLQEIHPGRRVIEANAGPTLSPLPSPLFRFPHPLAWKKGPRG